MAVVRGSSSATARSGRSGRRSTGVGAAEGMAPHCPVGLTLNAAPRADGVLSPGNAPLVERAVKIIEGLGETVASTKDARKILEL